MKVKTKKVVSVINQKGGIGKTTTALAIGHGLILEGFKVLFVDIDAQCNLSYTLQADINSYSTMDLLTNQQKINAVIQKHGEINVAPAAPSLAGADNLIMSVGKEYRLREAIENVKNYDFIIIDTPPALGILTVNALVASDEIIIPAQADVYSLQGIAQLQSTVEVVKKYCNSSLKISGILLTRHNPRSILTRDITRMIQKTSENIGTSVFRTSIRDSVAIREAQAKQKDIFSYAPNNPAVKDYREFLKELMENWNI